jgi:spore coat protein U-like protein
MSLAGSFLVYNVFQDGGRTTIWGDGAFGPPVSLVKTAKNQSFDLFMYGRIPAGQNLPPGSYTDTINITVTYPDVSSPYTDTVTVTADIVGSCSFTTSGSIDFGGLDPVLAPAVAGVVVQPQVRCSISMPYTITDNTGMYEAVPNNPPLRLRDTTVTANYIPYTIAYTSSKTGTGATDPMDIVATIAAGSYAGFPAYTYDDLITLTVTW